MCKLVFLILWLVTMIHCNHNLHIPCTWNFALSSSGNVLRNVLCPAVMTFAGQTVHHVCILQESCSRNSKCHFWPAFLLKIHQQVMHDPTTMPMLQPVRSPSLSPHLYYRRTTVYLYNWIGSSLGLHLLYLMTPALLSCYNTGDLFHYIYLVKYLQYYKILVLHLNLSLKYSCACVFASFLPFSFFFLLLLLLLLVS